MYEQGDIIMKEQTGRDEQVISDEANRKKELPNLTIAEKAAVEYFETTLDKRTFEPSGIVSMIHTIIGDNKPLNTRTPMTPSDDLAKLLIGLLRENAFDESMSLNASEAIECCFLHSPVYQLALRIYYLEHDGKLRSVCTAYEALQGIIDHSLTGAHPNATRANDQIKSHMQIPESDWAQQFGNMIAGLYGDKLTPLTHNELCDSIMQIANEGNTVQAEAQRLLPLGLRRIFTEQPTVRVVLDINHKTHLLCEIT
jgi:hypothetical protein